MPARWTAAINPADSDPPESLGHHVRERVTTRGPHMKTAGHRPWVPGRSALGPSPRGAGALRSSAPRFAETPDKRTLSAEG